MFNSKTVFILGAGASHEVGFPLGLGLRDQIAARLDFRREGMRFKGSSGDLRILERLTPDHHIDDYLRACRHIKDGIVHSNSIDDFIDIHQHDASIAICGKLAITSSILDAEMKSKLYVDPSNFNNTINFKLVDDTWYSKFYRLLTKQLHKTNIDKVFDNIIVVNFNYDRSLEHYLRHALSNHYRITKDEAKLLVDKLIVYRPYGSVGSNAVPFGSDELPPLDIIASNLKTYTEQVEDGDDLSRVHEAINEAKVIVFLGMAYHPNNMDLLKTSCVNINEKIIYGTRFDISDYDLPVVRQRIMKVLHPDIIQQMSLGLYTNFREHNILFEDECSTLFDTYKLSLSEHYS